MIALLEEGKEVAQKGSGEVTKSLAEAVAHEGAEEVHVREGHKEGMHAEVNT